MKILLNQLSKSFEIISVEKKIMQTVFFLVLLGQGIVAQVHSPENISFEQISTKDMVNLVTGDFSYSLPLIEVPGVGGSYPINLVYHAGIGMEQDASWLGLGWNISMGAINRNVKGYPDDWKNVKYSFSTKRSKESFNSFDASIKNNNETSWKVGVGSSLSQPVTFFKTPRPYTINEMTSAYNVYGENAFVYGPLYYKFARRDMETSWGTQNKNIVMDCYTNPYSSSTYNSQIINDANNSLSFPDYDDFAVSAHGLQGTMNLKLFEYGSLVRRGYVSERFDDQTTKQEFVYNNRIHFNKEIDQIHFYFNNENSGYYKLNSGTISKVGDDPIWGIEYSGVNTSKENPDGFSSFNEVTKRVGTGKFIQWYTNNQITNNQQELAVKGVMEYEKLQGKRSNLELFDPNGIGGFSITNEDGVTYHYALPVYNFFEHSISQDLNDPANNFLENSSNHMYATTWLLTAITGNDFVDNFPLGIINESDLGYWVKFDYGKWTDGYIWRSPYNGYEKSPTNNQDSYSWGRKQVYYLNSIKTKTHTAYFIKDLRIDGLGKDNFAEFEKYQYNYPISASSSGSSGVIIASLYNYNSISIPEKTKLLKLNKIILVKNGDIVLSPNVGMPLRNNVVGKTYYHEKVTLTGNTSSVVKNETTETSSFNLYYNDEILDVNDIQGLFSQINESAIKILDFEHDYSLCQNTPNNINTITNNQNSQTGKLSLKGVKISGEKNIQIIPKYKFQYYNSTSYNSTYKDDWGYYAGSFINSSIVNKDQFDKPDANSWSLKEIVNPEGGKIKITYESDSYNGEAFLSNSEGGIGGGLRVKKIEVAENDTKAYITEFEYLDPETKLGSGITSYAPRRQQRYVPYIHEIPGPGVMYKYVCEKTIGENGNLLKKTIYKFDVLQLSTNTMSHHFKLGNHLSIIDIQPSQGIYSNYETQPMRAINARSSLIFNNLTSLGKILEVTLLNNEDQIIEKSVFEYYKPQEIKSGIFQESFCESKQMSFWLNKDRVRSIQFFYNTSTSKIVYPSVLKSVRTTRNGVTSISNNNEFDFLTGKVIESTKISPEGKAFVSKITLAYLTYPEMGSKVSNFGNKNLLNKETANYLFVKEDINFTTLSFSSNTVFNNSVPLYNNSAKVAKNPGNSDQGELIKASVQTWKSSWNYRGLNSNNLYVENSSSTNNTWRPYQSYIWKSIPNVDGTIKTYTGNKQKFEDFNWSGANIKSNWQLVSEVKRMDENSNIIETADVNNLHSTAKTCHSGLYTLAKCNANYAEFTFSGAEEVISTTDFLEGEVRGASNRFDASTNPHYAHTGNYSVKLTSQAEGFKYSTGVGTNSNQMQKGRKYRASVWVRSHNSSTIPPGEATLVCKLFNAGNLISTSNSTATTTQVEKAGNWFQLTMEFEIPSSTIADKIEISASTLSSPSNAIYFDDFRVYPASIPMVSYVYNTKLGLTSAVLDGNNFAMKYVYDASGKLIEEYQEFIDRSDATGGFKKVKENSYNYARGLND